MFIILSTPNRFNDDKIIILPFGLIAITDNLQFLKINYGIMSFYYFER